MGGQEEMALHPNERRLIERCRQLKFGTIRGLVVKDGLPLYATEVEGRVSFDRGETTAR
jgi:hypothetical protein